MATYFIMCEGITDQTLIGEYLKDVSGWEYKRVSKKLFNGYDINYFIRGEDILGIGTIKGDYFIPFVRDFALRQKNNSQEGIDRLVIVADNDDKEEVNIRFSNIMEAMDEKLGKAHIFNPEESMNRWLSLDYVDEFSQEARFQYCFLTVPIYEQGSLETYMLNALANNQEEGAVIADSSSKFVDGLETKTYLKARRDKSKAKLGVAMSVFSPDRAVNSMVEIITDVDWNEFKETHRQFAILEEL